MKLNTIKLLFSFFVIQIHSAQFYLTAPHVEEERTRSLFHDRSLTPRSNSSMSSRRPSFNASTFASPTMTTFIDRTLSTRRVLDSPFYRGRTTYGGASAQGKKLGRSLQGSVQVKVKNEGGNGCVGLSRTARRILDTLEQYSTPVSDAKKIPVVKRREGVFEKYTGANPYGKVASNRELHVPTVPELLKMKQQLQESTEAVRQIATTSKSDLNREEYQIPSIEEESKKHTNKIKTKVCAVRQKPEETINLEQVKLPAVSLPISTLPKFDFSVPPPVSLSKTAAKPATPKEKTEFEFANPHVIAENLVSIVSTNSFKFSEPISRKQTINNFKIGDMGAFKPKRVQRNNGEIQPAVELITTGSVMDVLGKKNESLAAKFKPAEGSWECKTCFVRNQSSIDKCVACESRKVSDEVKKSPLIDKFKPVEGTWECTTCLIRNRASVDKCVACESFKVKQTPLIDKFKPQEGSWECTTCLVRNQPNVAKCVACEAPKKSPLIEKFKPAEGSWECTTCLVRNQATVSKCVACESLKPSIQVKNSPLLDKFKPPEGTWECATCLVRNQSTVNKCVACESPKPFGETKNSPLTEKFKSAEGTWECKTCLVRNQSNAIKCVACTSPKPISELKNSPLAEKFKPPEGTWECPVCMIRNQSDLMRCAACESPKTTPPPKAQLKSPQVQTTLPQPLKVSTEVWECEKCFVCNKKDNATCSGCNAPAKLGFGIRFKPDKDSWECSSCMVRNVPGAEKCVACEALSPEVKKRFKAKPTEWDCDKCKTKNAADKTKCCSCGADKAGSGFVFTKYSYGVDRQATSMFTFGIKAANNVQQNSNPSFIFGNMTKPVETTVKPTFSFGIPPANNNDSIQPEKAQPIQPAKPKEPEPSEKQLPNPSFSVNFSTDNSKLILPAQNNIFAKTDVQKPVFQFGNPSEQKPSIPAAGSLPEAPKPFPFGTATKLDESPAKVPSFSFGRKREAPEKGGESDTEKRPTFSFNAGEKTNTFQFGATPSQPSMQNGFSFGSGKTTEGGFSFGSSSQVGIEC